MRFRAVTWILVLSGSLIFASTVIASEPFEIPLWDGIAPGSEGAGAVVESIEDRGDADHPDRKVRGVTVPTITVHKPDPALDTGTAMILCPGGGYSGVVIDKSGHDIARYLNTLGVTGIVLKYRLPRPEGYIFEHDVPLRDVTRAVRLARHHAAEWGLDPSRIGVFGASAGGHLASTLATQFAQVPADTNDPVDRLSARTDFQVLLYPVISFREDITHAGSRSNLIGQNPSPDLVERYSNELHVTGATPPAFLVSTYDDHVKAENSLLYFKALRSAGVPAELHIYEEGGHGYGIRPTGKPVATWHHRMRDWMQQRGLLER